MSINRGEACSILILCVNTKCESMAYRSFGLKGVQLEVSEKEPQGIRALWQASAQSDVAY